MKSKPQSHPRDSRVEVDGKFFRLKGERFLWKGVAYGPFRPDSEGDTFGAPAQLDHDLSLLQELGANLLRVYYPPPRWFLDRIEQSGLKLFVDVPWSKHLCFLDSRRTAKEARNQVRSAVASTAGHPAILGFSVGNEIPADIVRYSGPARVEAFIEELIEIGRLEDPTSLFTYSNYPSTEYLNPGNTDFVSFNLYLHEISSYRAYLARLQMVADQKPLVLGEVGMDSLREGEAAVSQFLGWQIEEGFRKGLAGTCIFSFTDDWYRGGGAIEDWAFGLTTRQREKKQAFATVQDAFRRAPALNDQVWPAVSVVVASYNGEQTLSDCLQSLQEVDYPDFEVILVDDGSTDSTPAICQRFPQIKTIRQENRGLSAARNAGVQAAQGTIVAFTDSDCRVDRDWLRYLIRDLEQSGAVGIGGHNLLPPDDSLVAAAVMAAPGGPVHVMLSDQEAEHIPGCNMAFYKWALNGVGGFDPVFRKAGDDVDICWRLLQQGHRLAFSPASFVWHYRRSTVKAYLSQQMGYGEAEALLARKHPESFNRTGNSTWQGRIYGNAGRGLTFQSPVIYHGEFGQGLFQRLYAAPPSNLSLLATTLEYYVFLALPALLLALFVPPAWLIATPLLLLPVVVSIRAGSDATIPADKTRVWSRPLIGLLFLLQPVCRSLARYRTRMSITPAGRPPSVMTGDLPLISIPESTAVLSFWTAKPVERGNFVQQIMNEARRHGFYVQQDTGWHSFDSELMGDVWARFYLITTTEELDKGQHNVRCRFTVRWSLLANLIFFGSILVVALVIFLLASLEPWIWMLPLAPLLLLWVLEARQLVTLSIIGALTRQVADQLEMKQLNVDSPDDRSSNRDRLTA